MLVFRSRWCLPAAPNEQHHAESAALIFVGGPRDLDHSFWTSVQESQFRHQLLLQVELLRLPAHVNVLADPPHLVDVGQLGPHDPGHEARRVHAHELRDHEDHGDVEADDAEMKPRHKPHFR